MKTQRITLRSPLFTKWTEQYVRLWIDGLKPGEPCALRIDGKPADFQYTGASRDGSAEVMLHLGFERGQQRELEFSSAATSTTNLKATELPDGTTEIGVKDRMFRLTRDPSGLFDAFANFSLQSRIKQNGTAPAIRKIVRTNDGPLYIEYEIRYSFGPDSRYVVQLRCFRNTPYVEVCETFGLGMDSEFEMIVSPSAPFDKILSHVPVDFEGDTQPAVDDLAKSRPYDLVCRIQMPCLGEYFVPTNRSWFSLFDSKDEKRGMLGVLGLHGAKWRNPVVNMLRLTNRNGQTALSGSLESGQRYWLLYAGPVEKEFTLERAFLFDRLHAEFDQLRLDEHLDLAGDASYDANCWDKPGFYNEGYRERARTNAAALSPLRRNAEKGVDLSVKALLDPQPAVQHELRDSMFARLEKWVRQFQGYREGKNDYNKCVIGFSRTLRTMMINYELLRKDRVFSETEIGQFNAYFVFCARRILDEGRWAHSKSWLHPSHPDSTRDIYTYPGEHKPDRLVWTNCLPNFQSDPMCALLHLGALFPEHADAAHWRSFALDDLERQLSAYASPSGAWEESILYTLYTFSYFVTTFRVLKQRCGIDYFHDRRVYSIAAWLVRFFGPLDKRFNSYTFPGVGNSRIPQGYLECLLAYAEELDESDPLRGDLIAIYQKMEAVLSPDEHRPLLLAVASVPKREYPIRPLISEHMVDLGVSMRHDHPSPKESYLFQKIGFFKDHYEGDESAFNWYAKGTPLTMEYGTYTPDAGSLSSHNLIEIPDQDSLRRGYLADKYFTPLVDFTRSEVPVTLKLSYGHIRSFAEVDGPPQKPMYFYLGEGSPIGMKVWKTRLLLFVKPDYIVLFDRVFGAVPHRFNLHVTGTDVKREGAIVRAKGRFDLDLLCFVQTPSEFKFESGEFEPAPHVFGKGDANPHRQNYFRIYNETGESYRTVLFAQERGRDVTIRSAGQTGVHVTTPEYEDYVFIGDTTTIEKGDGFEFRGRVGWIRREKSGRVMASVQDGELISAFGKRIDGRGPYWYNMDHEEKIQCEGTPRKVAVG